MNRTIILLCLITVASLVSAETTIEKYGQNIVYYDFSKIPVDSLVLDKEIPLPNDLKYCLSSIIYSPRIQNPQSFERLFWEEANKLGLAADKFKEMDIQQAVTAIVKVVGSRITYCLVDKDTSFINKYGEHLSIDKYFYLGLGDCDKYRNACIAAFKIVKVLNPKLQNVYLSTKGFGGNQQPHAWVSVIIPQETLLILSHIDPTFYDNGGALEADEFHITLQNNIFLGYFYGILLGSENNLYAYQIFEKAVPMIEDEKQLENILDRMSFYALVTSIYNPQLAPEKILPVIQLYETKGFTAILDKLLYRAYKIYKAAGKTEEAEKYKQRLLTEFPNSYWVRKVKKIIDKF